LYSIFKGSFSGKSIDESTTSLLEQFVCMIDLDADMKCQLRFGASKIDVAMAQLLQYNCSTKYRDDDKTLKLIVAKRLTPLRTVIKSAAFSITPLMSSDNTQFIQFYSTFKGFDDGAFSYSETLSHSVKV
jgi:hypothetical protein